MRNQNEKLVPLTLTPKHHGKDLAECSDPLYPGNAEISYDHASVSNKRVRLKFDLQLDNMEEFCSIMEMVVSKLSGLKQDKIIESCELNLRAVPPCGKEKIANLDIFIDGNRFITESKSPRWDNAFLNAFDSFCSKIKS
ncbi:MAG TPA: hypothetical protein VFX43_16325 [Chitinophagaceae bacterium]|nr:hypothetical protein [Chitinophagaceae bacterium]